MRVENTARLSRRRPGIQLLLMIGMVVVGAGLVKVAGGFPPQAWIFLVQMVPRLPLLWRARGTAIMLPLAELLLVAFSLLVAWVLLLYFCVKVGKSLLAPRGVKQEFAPVGQWNEGGWRAEGYDEKTHPIILPLEEQAQGGRDDMQACDDGLVVGMEGQWAGLRGKCITDPLTATKRNEKSILGARERYYARFSEPETQPLERLAMACERPEGLSERKQRMDDSGQEAVATLMAGSGQKWWLQEEDGTREDRTGPERGEQWWAQMEQDDLPTTGPGQDEESDAPFIVEPDEVKPDRSAHFLSGREDGDEVGATKKGVESEEDVRPLAFFFGVGLDVGITHKGSPNEDCVFATTGVRVTEGDPEPTGLFMVADGLGGHEQGREASQLAVSEASDAMLPVVLREAADGGRDEEEIIVEGVRCANDALYRRNCEQATSMGTTITAVLLVGGKAYSANVGDSRTYLYRPGEGLRQVTRDHSLVMRMVEVGTLAREDVYVHPLRNQVYRSLGNAAEIEVETRVIDVREGDVLLLCSDGLWEMVRDDEIEEIIRRASGPTQASGKLVQAALRNGGADNIGVVVVSVMAADR